MVVHSQGKEIAAVIPKLNDFFLIDNGTFQVILTEVNVGNKVVEGFGRII